MVPQRQTIQWPLAMLWVRAAIKVAAVVASLVTTMKVNAAA